MSDLVAALKAVIELHRPSRGKCAECRKAFPCPTFAAVANVVENGRLSTGLVVPPGTEVKYVERRSNSILEPITQEGRPNE